MKKKMIAAILALGTGMLLFAAGNKDTPATIEGKLVITKSVPTIVSGDKTWVLPAAPFYQIAWENGIKVGDTVKAEGFAMDGRKGPGQQQDNLQGTLFMPTKVWVNGKQIDLSAVSMPGPFDGPDREQSMGGMSGDQPRGMGNNGPNR